MSRLPRECLRILFLSPWFPYPPDNGSKIRIFNLLKALGASHAVTLLSFADADFDPASLTTVSGYCSAIRTAPKIDFRPGRWKALAGFASSRPRSLVDTHSPTMAGLVREELARSRYDIVVASQLATAVYLDQVPDPPKIFEEVEVGLYQGKMQSGGGLRRLRHSLMWFKFASFLKRLIPQFDACTVVSRVEKSALEKMGVAAARISVLPNAVDTEWYNGTRAVPQPNAIVFNGALTYSANYDAVQFFLERIYPRVRASNPDVHLYITGRTDGVAIQSLPADRSVTFTGYLPDVRPMVAASGVCIVPLREGGGTRLKILEAMALGTPVVTTSKGVEGLDVSHGESILIADDPATFAQYTIDVLGSAALRNHLAANARRLVESQYNWKTVGREFESLLREVVERSRV